MTTSDPFDQSRRATVLTSSAESCADQRDWENADRLFLEALSLAPSLSIQIAYANRLAEQERYFEAISLFTQVLDSDDSFAIGIVCHNLAVIYRQLGDQDLARRFQWRATLLQDDLGSDDLLGMANDALLNNQIKIAESLVMTARTLSNDDEEPGLRADLTATEGIVKGLLESPRAAVRSLFKAFRQRRACNDLQGMGVDLLNIAAFFSNMNRIKAERACLVRAIHLFEQISAPILSQKARQQLVEVDENIQLNSFDVRRN